MNATNYYYENILRPYLKPDNPNLLIDTAITGTEGTTLRATEIQTNSPTGIIIIPGITVPRKACTFGLLRISMNTMCLPTT